MIQVSHLFKNYGKFAAVNDVSFSVGEKITGLLGPNGAGKTTVMKILTGYHYPSAGTAQVAGISVTENPVACKKLIGYLPESVPLYGELTVDEYLTFIAESRLIPKNERKSKIDSAIERCGLGLKRKARIETLSKGYKQRTGLAQSILHDPPVLILDEPTTGLDPNQIIEIRSLIKELGSSKTVILSTHILQEVEAMCEQVLILNEGRIAAQGTPDSIARSMRGGETWTILVKGGSAGNIRENLERFAIAHSFKTENLEVTGTGEDRAELNFFLEGGTEDSGELLFDWAVEYNYKLLSMRQKKLSLEDIFVRLTA
ncbi:MAG: ATP-binding cassette domain-containing protein [Spirochaetaceae bacterium]|jgi:ABC-2 type transport system ATP-binding protein|nr:ATP-binding cassette domain-containing protein [Spirochaetaceae bacterium]